MTALRIGNGKGFWGDDVDAPVRLAASGAIDVLTLDYLAEVTLSILARQRKTDPAAGWARDFAETVAGMVPLWRGAQPNLRVIANAGGLNPESAASACRRKLSGMTGFRIGVVAGDDLMPHLDRLLDAGCDLANLETGEPIAKVRDRLVSANAYLGAAPMAEALAAGAKLVITGRVADPSMTVAAAIHGHGWRGTEVDRLAGATVAGHLTECGTQVTGGIWTDWLGLADAGDIGFPVAEVEADGSLVITKPAGTGGAVNLATVKEQLVYEIGDPANYISPDVVVDFTSLKLREVGRDRIAVTGTRGKPATEFYKVSASYHDGWTAAGTLTIFGSDAIAKARRAGEAVRERLRRIGVEPTAFNIECLGAGACAPGVMPEPDAREVVLRLAAADARREVIERFAKELVPLVTSGPQGTTGYFAGRPQVREVLAYWPCLVPKRLVTPTVRVETV